MDFTPIDGTDGAVHPVFSPDGRWIAFVASGRLKKVAISGGAPVDICELVGPKGLTWGNGQIVFGDELGTHLSSPLRVILNWKAAVAR